MTGIKIMLCQREALSALDLKYTLQDLGYVVTLIVSRGLDVSYFADGLVPDLALIDIDLGGCLGSTETAAMLLEDYGVPSIYMLDRDNVGFVARNNLMDSVGYLVNPAVDAEISTCIEHGLMVHKQRQELVSNLNWHRTQLDVSLAQIESLRSRDELLEG